MAYAIINAPDGYDIIKFDERHWKSAVTYHIRNGECDCPAAGRCKHLDRHFVSQLLPAEVLTLPAGETPHEPGN